MRPRLLVAALLTLLVAAASGCLGDDEDRGPSASRPAPARLERPELVAFRVAGASTVRYELLATRAGGRPMRVLARRLASASIWSMRSDGRTSDR